MATDNETTPVDLDITDAALFDEAISDTPAEPETAQAEPEATAEATQARDENGRFAANEVKPETTSEQAPKVETQQAQEDDKGGGIPGWRVREINAEKAELARKFEAAEAERTRLATQFEAMQREMQSLRKPVEQPKEQKPDPLIDPEGYERYIERKFEDRLLNERRESSLALAHRTYKQDFEEAYAAVREAMAKGDVAITAKMQQSRDPGETLMAWHREQKTMREVGNDPNAFFEKRLDAWLQDPANQAKVMERARGGAQSVNGQTQRPNVQLPPSLSNMSRAEGSRGGDDDTDLSDEALFRQALR